MGNSTVYLYKFLDSSSFPSCTWERNGPRNFIASARGKHSFANKCVPKYNLGTR